MKAKNIKEAALRLIRHTRNYYWLVAIVGCAFFFGIASPIHATAGINEQINYQGRLLDSTGAVVADGTYNMEFKIYQDGDGCVTTGSSPCSGTLKWTETRTSTNKVTLRNGYFSVQLGEVTAFGTSVDWNQSVLWLSVNIGGTGTPSWDGEMTPFRRLGADAYALNAKQLGGLDATHFLQIAPSSVQADTSTSSSLFLNKSGASGNILQLQKNASDVFTVTNGGALVFGGTGTATFTTPVGTNVQTKISLPLFDPGSFGQILMFGLPSTASSSARAITLVDARTVTHQPTLSVLSPGETDYFGLSWDGSNTTASLKTSVNNMNFAANGVNVIGLVNNSGQAVLNIGAASSNNSLLAFYNSTNGNSVGLQTGVTSASYNLTLPTSGPSTSQCLQTDSVTATQLKFAACSGGGSTLQTAYDTGNTIAATDSRNITLTMPDTTTDPNLLINLQCVTSCGGNGRFAVQSGGTDVLKVAPNGGAVTMQNSVNSTAALLINNSAGSTVVGVDTTGANQNNLVTNASVETAANIGNAGDWQKRGGTETTFAQDTTQQYIGLASLKTTTTATAGDGVKQNVTLTNGTTYTLSFYAKLDTASNTMATMQAGYAYNGSDITTLVSQNFTPISNGWARFSYTFKQNQTNASTPYIFIKQTDAAIHTFYIDGVTLQTDANADNNYREGKIQLNGTVTSPVVLQNASNSVNAFQVQNAAGAAVFTVDTTDTNLVGNPGAEVNTTGWTPKGAGTIIRDTSQQKFGSASFKITATATANDGAQYAGLNLPVGTYSIGLSVKLSSGAFGAGTLAAGITNTGGDTNCVLAPAVSATVPTTTGWTRFTCSVTIATTAGMAFYIKQTDAVSRTYWVDGIELDSGATLTPYGVGGISFNGILKTPLTMQNQSDSTSALTLQTAAGLALLNVDTLNTTLNLGVTGATATASTINLATTTGNATQTINIGATNAAANSVQIKGGTGASAIGLQAGAAGTISIGTTASNVVTIGNTAATAAITVGQSTGTNTISIGNALTAAGATQTINIGAGALNSTGLTSITIGNSNASSGSTSVIIKAGTTTTTKGPSVTLGATASTSAVCSSLANATAPTGGTAYELRDCNATPAADFAEMYPAASNVEVGDVVAQGAAQVNTYDWDPSTSEVNWDSVKGTVSQMVKSTVPYGPQTIGVVSDNYLDFASTGYNIKKQDNPTSIALVGRVNVKVSLENGAIAPGDFLTASATKPGYAMKATKPGYAIGQALASFTSDMPGKVMVFVHPGFFAGDMPAMIADFQNGTVNSLSINTLKVPGSLTVAGDAVFHGLVSVKNLVITGHIKVGGDTAGTTTIAHGQQQVHIAFTTAYDTTPVITLGSNDFTPVKVTNKTVGGFDIAVAGPLTHDLQIDWTAVEVAGP